MIAGSFLFYCMLSVISDCIPSHMFFAEVKVISLGLFAGFDDKCEFLITIGDEVFAHWPCPPGVNTPETHLSAGNVNHGEVAWMEVAGVFVESLFDRSAVQVLCQIIERRAFQWLCAIETQSGSIVLNNVPPADVCLVPALLRAYITPILIGHTFCVEAEKL